MADDIAMCMYHTGIDPFTRKPVQVAKKMSDRKFQRALMQFLKPENHFEVRGALVQAKRQDLLGNECDCLIPAIPPKEAIEGRRKQANAGVNGDHYHAVPKPKGYRPGRKSAKRRSRP